MQAYQLGFAHAYNHFLGAGFAARLGPRIQGFYEATAHGRQARQVLDLCCGTGHLAAYFLAEGYQVHGIDLSASMLHYARQNAAPYLARGQASFQQADACDFQAPRRYGLALSSFDALNHLPDEAALARCFRQVYKAVAAGGYFIFDLNTRHGLTQWAQVDIQVEEEGQSLAIRGRWTAPDTRAYMTFSGQSEIEGQRVPFEEEVFEQSFELAWVQQALRATGWQEVTVVSWQDINQPLSQPEAEEKVMIIAQR